jgi:hypothetical protein
MDNELTDNWPYIRADIKALDPKLEEKLAECRIVAKGPYGFDLVGLPTSLIRKWPEVWPLINSVIERRLGHSFWFTPLYLVPDDPSA